MKKSVNNVVLSTLTAAFLIGCNSSTSTSSTSAGGASQKGPFKAGQTVTAQKLSDLGTNDTAVSSITTTTDSLGKFQFSNIPWSGPTEFTVEGEYLDESTGEYVPGGLLTAVTNVEVGTAPKVNINILTHIAAKNIKEQMANNISITEAKEKAKEVVSKVFKIDLSSNTELEDLDITEGNDDTNKIANTQLLKISAALTKTDDPAKTLDNLVEDLKDGEINDEAEATFEELKQKESEVKLDEVAKNIKTAIETEDSTALKNLPTSDDLLAGTMSLNNSIVFDDELEAEVTTSYESNVVVVNGIYGTNGASISITNGEFTINGNTYSSTTSTINNGDTLQVKSTSSNSYDTKTSTIVTIGGVDFDFNIVTMNDPFVADTKIKAFDFISKTSQALSTEITSDAVTIEGINTATNVSVTNGTLEVSTDNGTTWNTGVSQVNEGDLVRVKQTTSNEYSARVKSTVTFGSGENEVIAEFKSYTLAQDKTPDIFSFATKYDQTISSDISFDSVSITGITGDVEIKVENGQFSVDNGTTWNSSGVVNNNDEIIVKHSSSDSYNTKTSSRLIVGTKIIEFISYTTAEPNTVDLIPNEFKFTSLYDTELSTTSDNVYIESSESVTVEGLSDGDETEISVKNGEFSINNGIWNSENSTVKNGDSVKIRHLASVSNVEKTETTLTIGGISSKFISFTKAPVDTVPNPFGFAILESQVLDTLVASSIQHIRGINTSTTASINIGEISINGGAWATSGTVKDNDTIQIRHTTSNENSTKVESTLTIGNDVDGKYTTKFVSITKKAAPIFSETMVIPVEVNSGSLYSFTPTVTGATEFEIENKPSWAVFNPRNGQLSGTPNSKELEKTYENIIITAKNDGGETTLSPFSIAVNNIAPIITLSSQSLTKSIYNDLSIDVTVSDTVGETFTYELIDAPSFVTIDSSTGKISGTNLVAGTYSFKVKVTDSSSVSIEETISLNVVEYSDVPTKPEISGTPNTTVNEDENYLFTPSASDINSTNLTFSIENKPSWANFDEQTGTLSGIPSNDDVATYENIIISVTESTDTVSLTPFSIEVVNTNDTPIGSTISSQNISLDDVSSYSLDVKSFFSDVDTKHGDSLTYDVTFSDGTLLPSWLSFTAGILTSNATSDNVGEYEMKATATDTSGEKSVINFTLSVQKDKFTQAIDIIKSIDPEFEDIDTKLAEAKAILDTLASKEAKVVGILISIAEIANNQAISDIVQITNRADGQAYLGSNLNALVRHSTFDFVNFEALVNNAATSNLSSTTTATIHEIATKLKSLSDELGNYFLINSDSYTYNGDTMTYDDANALRATALAVAFKLENLSAYQWGVDSDFAVQTDLGGNEFIKLDVDPAAVLNSGTFFKLNDGAKVETAKTYLVEALDMASKLPVGYDNGSVTQGDLDIVNDLKAAFAGNGQYTFNDFDEVDDEKSVTIDLNKMFSSTTALSITDLGSSWENTCDENATLYAGVNNTVATSYGYALCEYSNNYGMWQEDAGLDPSVLPTSTTSKIDEIILNITLKDNSVLTGQGIFDYLFADDEENTFSLEESMISQKQITVVDGNDTTVVNLYSDYTYFEEGNYSGDMEECSGSWSIDSSNSNKINFSGTCDDGTNSSSTNYYVIFNEQPATGSSITVLDEESNSEVDFSITSFGDAVVTSVVTYDSLAGKKVSRTDGFSYYFVDNKVYRGDADTSNFDSYGWTEEFTYQELSDGTLKLISSWGDYDILSDNGDGSYSIVTYYSGGGSYSTSTNSTVSEYTLEEINLVLTDVPTRMVAVDPYIDGANFCADLNNNNSCDTNEPLSTYSSFYDGGFMFHEIIPHGTPILMNEKGKHLGEEFDGSIKAYAGDGTVISPLTTLEVNGFTQTQIINILESYGIGISNFNLDPFKVFNDDSAQSIDYADLQATIAVHTFLKMTDYGLTPDIALDTAGNLVEPYASAMNMATTLIKSTLNETLASQYSQAPVKYIVYTAVAISNYLVEKVATLNQESMGSGKTFLQAYLADTKNISTHIGLLANAYMNNSSKYYQLNSDGTTAIEVGSEVSLISFIMDNHNFNQIIPDERYTVLGNMASYDETNNIVSLTTQKVLGDESRTSVKTKFETPKQMVKANVKLGDTNDGTQRIELLSYMFDKQSLTGINVQMSVRNNKIYYYLEKDIYSDEDTISSTVSLDSGDLSSNTYEGNLVVPSETSYNEFDDVELSLVMVINPSTGKLTLEVYDINGILGSSKVIDIPNYEAMNLGFDSSRVRVRVKGATETTPETTTGYFAGFETENLVYAPTATIANGVTALFSDENFEWLDIAKFNESTLDINMYGNYDGNGFSFEENETIDISYSSDNTAVNLIENNSTNVICTNSNTVKINNVNGIVYSDLYRSKNSCVNQTTTTDNDEWSWNWNENGTYSNDISSIVTLFTNGSYFEHAEEYFVLASDYNVYLAAEDGTWENGDKKIVSTSTIAGQWNSDSDSINITMNNTYKFNAEIILNSSNKIEFNYENLPGYTEGDYIWTGSSIIDLFKDITGINPDSSSTTVSNLPMQFIKADNSSLLWYFNNGIYFERGIEDGSTYVDIGTYSKDSNQNLISLVSPIYNDGISFTYDSLSAGGIITPTDNSGSFTINEAFTNYDLTGPNNTTSYYNEYDTSNYSSEIEALFYRYTCSGSKTSSTGAGQVLYISSQSDTFCHLNGDLYKAVGDIYGNVVSYDSSKSYGVAAMINGVNYFVLDKYAYDSTDEDDGALEVLTYEIDSSNNETITKYYTYIPLTAE